MDGVLYGTMEKVNFYIVYQASLESGNALNAFVSCWKFQKGSSGSVEADFGIKTHSLGWCCYIIHRPIVAYA